MFLLGGVRLWGLPWGAANPVVCLTRIRAARRLLTQLHRRIQRRDAEAAAGSVQESKHRFLFRGEAVRLVSADRRSGFFRGKKTTGWSANFNSDFSRNLICRMEKLTHHKSEWLRQRQHGESLSSRSSPQQTHAALLLPSHEDGGILNSRSISAAC